MSSKVKPNMTKKTKPTEPEEPDGLHNSSGERKTKQHEEACSKGQRKQRNFSDGEEKTEENERNSERES